MEYQIKNILVPTDFSETGNNAVMLAVCICERFGATLHVLHVWENLSARSDISSEIKLSEVEHQSRIKLSDILEKIVKGHKINVQIHSSCGILSNEICNTAMATKSDMVVMGVSGTSDLRNLVIATTVFNLIKRIPIPVLAIPGNFSTLKFEKVLFPIRPVNGAKEKYAFIKPFLTHNSSIHIAAMCSLGELELLSGHRNELHEIISSLKEGDIAYSTKMYTCNNLASKVLELSDTLNVDLIAINATLDYKWRQFFAGPYTQQLVNHAKVPLLIFRNAAGKESNPQTQLKAQIKSPEADKLSPLD